MPVGVASSAPGLLDGVGRDGVVGAGLPCVPRGGDAAVAAATSPSPCINDSIPLHAVHVGGKLDDEVLYWSGDNGVSQLLVGVQPGKYRSVVDRKQGKPSVQGVAACFWAEASRD